MKYALTVGGIPMDDHDNWNDPEPFEDEWVLSDRHGDAIAVYRDHGGADADDALRAMVAEGKILGGWKEIEEVRVNRWLVTFPDE